LPEAAGGAPGGLASSHLPSSVPFGETFDQLHPVPGLPVDGVVSLMGGARLPRLDMTPPQAARTLQRITDSLNAVTLAAMPGGGHGTLGSISCQTPPLWPLSLGVPLLAVSAKVGMFGRQGSGSRSQSVVGRGAPTRLGPCRPVLQCAARRGGSAGVRCAVAVASPAPGERGPERARRRGWDRGSVPQGFAGQSCGPGRVGRRFGKVRSRVDEARRGALVRGETGM